jgi:DNA polymerase III alpha subunit
LVLQVDAAMQAAEAASLHSDQTSLFGEMGSADSLAVRSTHAAGYGAAMPTHSERTCLLEEKTALGFCLSGSLFDEVRGEMGRFAPTPLGRLMPSKEPIWIAGVVSSSRGQMTKRGMMRVVELDDGLSRLEVTVFNELFDSRRGVLRVDEPLLISARIENDEFSGGLRGSAVEILTLAEARGRYAKGVRLSYVAQTSAEAAAFEPWLQALKSSLARPGAERMNPGLDIRANEKAKAASGAAHTAGPVAGVCPVFVQIELGQERCEIALGKGYGLVPDPAAIEALRDRLRDTGTEVSVIYA